MDKIVYVKADVANGNSTKVKVVIEPEFFSVLGCKDVDLSVLAQEVEKNRGRAVDITHETTNKAFGDPIKKGTYIESVSVKIKQAFSGGESPSIVIGDEANPDGYASLSASDIGSTGRVISDGAKYGGMVLSADSQPVVIVSGGPTSGEATIVINTRSV